MNWLRISLLLLITFSLQAQGHFTYSPLARQAYDNVTSFRFSQAYLDLARLKLEDPGNLIVHHIEDYLDFFHLFIGEDEKMYRQLKANRDRRLRAIQAGDPSSPYYLYLQADIRLHWALIHLRFDSYLPAFTDINKANKLLEENQEAFPDFMPNLKNLAVLHAIVGTIPDGYQWSVRLLSSLDGTIAQGKEEIDRVVRYARQNDFVFRREVEVLQAYLLLHLANRPQEAWQAIRASQLQPSDNPLHAFVMANIALRSGHNDEAIRILERAPHGGAFHPLPYLHYLLGMTKLNRLDRDAGPHFQRYLEQFKGQRYVKEAYQKMAWQALINGDAVGYRRHMSALLERGSTVEGGDRNAQREAETGRTPPVEMIKARLLFDGHYYQEAYDLLEPLQLDRHGDEYIRLEYLYRMGRITQGLGRKAEALNYFKQTIEEGQNKAYFFACNAALQSGLIYEAAGEYERAKDYFQQCLLLNPDEYAAGLHQKAKAGLSRIRRSDRKQ